MSAWPEAVYIIRQIQNSLSLNQRVVRLQNRLFVFAPVVTGQQSFIPDLQESYEFSDDSIWFIQKTGDPSKIQAISVYSQESGWSSPAFLSPDPEQIDYTPISSEGVFANVDTIKEALDALGSALDSGNLKPATRNSLGTVRIGTNILLDSGTNNTDAVISVQEAPAKAAPGPNDYGVVKLYTEPGQHVDGTMTQAAITSAIGQNAASSENVLVSASDWSSTTTTLSGDTCPYYTISDGITLQASYGSHPTISIAPTGNNDVPTQAEIEAFNNINFIKVVTNKLTPYAKIKPTISFTMNVKV